jgi:hypothetical protein
MGDTGEGTAGTRVEAIDLGPPNHQLSWQRRSINALRCFPVDLITVEAGR